MSKNSTIEYFGMGTVEKAVASYFARHGVTEEVREHLMELESADGDEFFQLVSDFVEATTTVK